MYAFYVHRSDRRWRLVLPAGADFPTDASVEEWEATRVRSDGDTNPDVRAEVERRGYCLFSLGGSFDDLRDDRGEAATSAPPVGTMPPWPELPPASGKVELVEVTKDHIQMARELATDAYVPTIGTLAANATTNEASDWVHRQQSRLSSGHGFSFTIVRTSDGAAIGHCGLWLRELAEGRASAGYSIIPSARGDGLATDALTALTQFAWTVPELHRVALFIEPWNLGSVRTAERAGYQREGLLRSHQMIGGGRRDMLVYASIRRGFD